MGQRIRYGRISLATAVDPDLAARVQREAKRRGTSTSALLAALVARTFRDPIPSAVNPRTEESP